MKRYYSLVKTGTTADIDIYGDITSWPWRESDVSSYNLSKELAELDGVDTINVNINSNGGDVKEGIAIYNALKRHSANVVTRCDGFACSIASVIFMAGDERIMYDASLLMIHNAWTSAWGVNADELRKIANDLDTITQLSKNAYMSNINISEDELTELMDNESWITPQKAVDMGFATSIDKFDSENISQCARKSLFDLIMQSIENRTRAVQKDTCDTDEPDDEPCEPDDNPIDDEPCEPDDEQDDVQNKCGDEDDTEEKCGDDEKEAQKCASFISMAFKN